MLGKYLFDETLETLEDYQHSEAKLDDFLNIPLVAETPPDLTFFQNSSFLSE